MARRGVWDLERVLIRYCTNGGSSRGVRDYIRMELVDWAKANPSFNIETKVRIGAHPRVLGVYRNRYMRVLNLKNMDLEQVKEQLAYLRNTLGHKVPRHKRIIKGIFESDGIIHTGMQRSVRADVDNPALAILRTFQKDCTFSQLKDELGCFGMATLLSGFHEYPGTVQDFMREHNPELLNRTAAGTPVPEQFRHETMERDEFVAQGRTPSHVGTNDLSWL
ncbi:54S ribosomal protein L51, mitochondrial [Porphyridium purpureum]|uniref:Large ribosomal subunit protein mL43 n=1 Tax=Porphyridium purpureum TaxID=35688 RepID=A0A5J4YV13_PORPP|nr:54S ribosomal protein L51, mitochondrial [Porphyridium purpureum]|eukprot:POR4291..scf209_3